MPEPTAIEARVADLLREEQEGIAAEKAELEAKLAGLDDRLTKLTRTQEAVREHLGEDGARSRRASSPRRAAPRGRKREPAERKAPVHDRESEAQRLGREAGDRDRQREKGQSEAQRSGKAAETQGRRDQVLDFVRAHPGCSGAEIAKGTGLSDPAVSYTLKQLLRGQTAGAAPPLRRERDGVSNRHYAAESPLTGEQKENGTRSKLEDAIVRAIAAASSGLYLEGIRTTIDYERKPAHASIETVCKGLVGRGVLAKADDGSYELAD
jgi:hypothetical protein